MPTSAPNKATLLLVDDNPSNLIALQAVFGSDYNLVSANSGQEALDQLQAKEVDVILLDIQMPKMDGYETTRRIKQIEQCKNIPIIFITAIFTENPFVKKGYELGAMDYFTKPFDPDILRMKVSVYASFRQKDALLRDREKRIKESEELLKAGRKLSAVLENLTVGVVIADTEGRVVQTNEAVLRIWKSIEPSRNDSYGEFLSWWGHDGQMIKDAFTRAIKGGESTHNEVIEITCFDKSLKTVINSVSPLLGLDDKIVGAAAVIQDVTEHKKIEEDMELRIMKLISIGVELEQTAQ
jgi:PAS domain S-box-containing protein